MKHKKPVALFGILALLTACAQKRGTDASVSLAFTGTAASASTTTSLFNQLSERLLNTAHALDTLTDDSGAPVTIESAWLRIKEIELKTAETATAADTALTTQSQSSESEVESESSSNDATSAEDNIRFRGPYAIDLLATDVAPIDTQSVPAGVYRRIRWKLEHNSQTPEAGAPAALAGNSIVLQGHIGTASFTYEAADDTQFEISGPNGVTVATGDALLVEIRFADLFAKINMSSVTDGAVISAEQKFSASHACDQIDNSAGDIYTCIRKGLEQAGDFGKGSDQHHDLDHAESERVK